MRAVFGIDSVSDHNSSLPHLLPSAEDFAQQMGLPGIGSGSFVLVYDTPGLMSEGPSLVDLVQVWLSEGRRAEWRFEKWMAEGRAVTGEPPSFEPQVYVAHPDRSAFTATRRFNKTWSAAASRLSISALPPDSPEPTSRRAGLRSRHIPRSLTLPFNFLNDPETGELRQGDELVSLFTTRCLGGMGLAGRHPGGTRIGSMTILLPALLSLTVRSRVPII